MIEKFSSRKVKIEIITNEDELGIRFIIKRRKDKILYNFFVINSDELWQSINDISSLLGKISHSARSWFNNTLNKYDDEKRSKQKGIIIELR